MQDRFFGRLENTVNNKVFTHFEGKLGFGTFKNIVNNGVFAKAPFKNIVNNGVFASCRRSFLKRRPEVVLGLIFGGF